MVSSATDSISGAGSALRSVFQRCRSVHSHTLSPFHHQGAAFEFESFLCHCLGPFALRLLASRDQIALLSLYFYWLISCLINIYGFGRRSACIDSRRVAKSFSAGVTLISTIHNLKRLFALLLEFFTRLFSAIYEFLSLPFDLFYIHPLLT